MTKESIIDAANAELARIGVDSSFNIGLNCDGLISAGDESGYYPCLDYKNLVKDLQEFEDNCITDQAYDGDQHYIWRQIWDLFSV
jgi:hypothetical protein